MSAPRYEIRSINDLLQFDEDAFLRLLPDLALWHKMMREAVAIGAEPVAMIWVDDGKEGQFNRIDMIDPESGEVTRITGPAYEGDRND